MATLGAQIKSIRKKQQISQSELEKKTGIKREYISKLEQDRLRNPTLNTMVKIAEGLNVPLESLLLYNPSSTYYTELVRQAEKIEKTIDSLTGELLKLKQKLHIMAPSSSLLQKCFCNKKH